MPKVNGKSFPYTPKGMAAAKKAEKGGKASPEAKASYMAGREVKKQSEQMGQNPAVKAVAAKKAALKKKAATSKPMSMKEAMKGVRVIPSSGTTPQKAAPTGMKMLGKKMK